MQVLGSALGINRLHSHQLASNYSGGTLSRGGSLCHTTEFRDAERSTATLTWVAPAQYEGNIEFRTTFVKVQQTFWVQVKSETVVATGFGEPPVTPEPTTPPPTGTTTKGQGLGDLDVVVDLDRCGIEKGCFRTPADCDVETCDIIVSWDNSQDDGYVTFKVFGVMVDSQNYLTLAFSPTNTMENASVVDCIYDGGNLIVQSSFNVAGQGAHENQVLTNPELGLKTDSFAGNLVDGAMSCQFERVISLPSTAIATAADTDGERVFNIDNSFYLLIAKGAATGNAKGYHGAFRAVSKEVVNVVTENIDIGGGFLGASSLMIAHGCLMSIAWMTFASFAIILPRYYKDAWPGEKIMKKDIWFQLHQPCMALCMFCTLAGFIIIFIDVGGYSQLSSPGNVHPPLGIIATILVIANPIMSVARCTPDDPNRRIFNWAHFFVGELAHISSGLAIFFAVFYVERVTLPEWNNWVVVAWICWHVCVEIVLSIQKCMRERKSDDNPKNSFDLTDEGGVDTFRTFVLVLHGAACLAFSFCIVVELAML